jgi:hypothetical protein
LNSSVTANANSNPDKFNGPVTFGDRSGELQLNQLYLYLQRAAQQSGDAWDFGARFDFMYGTDAIFTQAYGVPTTDLRTGVPMDRGNWDLRLNSWNNRFYGIALPQAYAELNAPVGTGLNVKVGHFYTHIGYEVVTAPDNFFFTKPYTFQYGEPFTHTGFIATYNIDQNWMVRSGAATGSATGGWDGTWNQQLGAWSYLGGLQWTSDDTNYQGWLTTSIGPRSEQWNDLWALYSLVFNAHFLDKTLHFVLQHDHGFADNVMTADAAMSGQGIGDATWYGFNGYVFYDIKDNLSVGLRGEWFRDDDGFRVLGPARCGASNNYNPSTGEFRSYACPGGNWSNYAWGASNYSEITAGLTYKPVKWVMVRPNVRYDWSTIDAFNSGNGNDQFLFSTDVVITF